MTSTISAYHENKDLILVVGCYYHFRRDNSKGGRYALYCLTQWVYIRKYTSYIIRLRHREWKASGSQILTDHKSRALQITIMFRRSKIPTFLERLGEVEWNCVCYSEPYKKLRDATFVPACSCDVI